MNEIVNKFLLAGDKFMPEMHLRDPIVGTYSACDHLLEINKEFKNLRKQEIQTTFTERKELLLLMHFRVF